MFNQITTLAGIRHKICIGQQLFYACLVPEFKWFNKEFSILRIVAPCKGTIKKCKIYPDTITTVDRSLLPKNTYHKVLRKYKLDVYLDNDETFSASIFELMHEKIVVIPEKHIFVYETIDSIRKEFNKLLIYITVSLNSDPDTTILKNDNFKIFKQLYDETTENYPEEIIKNHVFSNTEINGFFSNFCYNIINQKEVTMNDLKFCLRRFYEK